MSFSSIDYALVLTSVMSGETHDRFAVLKNLERAEKRFLLSFLVALAGGSYWLTLELWGLNLSDLLRLPLIISTIHELQTLPSSFNCPRMRRMEHTQSWYRGLTGMWRLVSLWRVNRSLNFRSPK